MTYSKKGLSPHEQLLTKAHEFDVEVVELIQHLKK